MKHVQAEKNQCCGCTACAAVCPVGAITMRTDEEGFLYPAVDSALCVDCGKCREVCAFTESYPKAEPRIAQRCVAAVHTDAHVRAKSRSGGVFYALHMAAVSRFGQQEDAVALTQVQFGAAALCCWVMSLVTEGLPGALPEGAWAELIYLAVFATTAALLLQNVGQAVTPASQAAILLSLESVFGVLFSVLFGGESVTIKLLCGFGVIFAAVLVSEVGGKRAA